MSELNYIDTGFGSKLIDFTQAPFDNVDNQNTVEFGFGNKAFVDDAGIGVGDFNNTKSQNFGSKKVNLTKKEAKYEYEDIFERGSINVNKNSFGEITIKNRLISNPILSCTTSVSGLASDISINIERISTRKFRVFNPSNKNIQVNYIASFDNVNKTNISQSDHELLLLGLQNKSIKEYSESYIILTEPKYETTQVKKFDIEQTTSTEDSEYEANLILNTSHNFIFGRTGTPGAFALPTTSQANNFLSIHMPTIEEAIEGANDYYSSTIPASSIINEETGLLIEPVKIVTGIFLSNKPFYMVEDIDNEGSSTVASDTPSVYYPYGLDLQLSTNYYFWYSPNFVGNSNPDSPGAWLYSTIRFPNNITYN